MQCGHKFTCQSTRGGVLGIRDAWGTAAAAFVISVECTLAFTALSSMLSYQHLDAEFVGGCNRRDILLADWGLEAAEQVDETQS